MKIILFAEYNCTGGARSYVVQLLEFYKSLGAEVLIVSAKNCSRPDKEIDSLINSYGFSIVKTHKKVSGRFAQKEGLRYFAEYFQYRKLLKTINPDFAVASVSSPGLFAGALRGATRSIYILHSLISHMPPLRGWRRLLRKLSFQFLFDRRHRILTVSRFLKSEVESEWDLNSPHIVCCLHNTAGDMILGEVSVSKIPLVVLTLGHVRDYKNPLLWISVASEVLAMVGKDKVVFQWLGEGELLDHCISLVEAAGLSENVQFLGHQKDAASFYKTCSIYFQPSLVENCALSVLDAMRYSKACVVSHAGGLPELIQDHESGFIVDPRSVQDMATKIIQLVLDPSMRTSMGLMGGKRYEKIFQKSLWEAEMRKYHYV